MAQQNKKPQAEQDVNALLKVRHEKLANLQEAGRDPFQITKYDVTVHSQDIRDRYDELEGQEVSLAGRMMFKRVMGKASFCNIQDLKGKMQLYVARDEIGEESYADFKKYDIGDILGVKGKVFKTKTGEISVHAEEIVLLSKSLQILPEKHHGLTDTDTRYRQRYVDLIMNEDSLLIDIDWMRIGFQENLGRYGKIWWEWMQQNHPEQLIFSLKNDYYLVLHHEINLRAEVEYRELYTKYMIEQKTGTFSEQSEKASRKAEEQVLQQIVYRIPPELDIINHCKTPEDFRKLPELLHY